MHRLCYSPRGPDRSAELWSTNQSTSFSFQKCPKIRTVGLQHVPSSGQIRPPYFSCPKRARAKVRRRHTQPRRRYPPEK